MTDRASDLAAIGRVMAAFFSAFTNTDGAAPDLDGLFDLFVPEGVIASATRTPPVVASVRAFIEPRRKILTDGTLVEFSERELESRTDVFGDMAHRLSLYTKSGILDGRRFESRGLKSTQLVRTARGWRIVAVTWSDERDGAAPLDGRAFGLE